MPTATLSIDYSELTALARKAEASPRHTKAQAVNKLRSASLALERRVKVEMPVDTGRARASWGHWTPSDLRPGLKGFRQIANAGDAVWEEDEDGLSIQQGSNIE